MARALATEHRLNPTFVHRVLRSMNDDYHADADDVALEYVGWLRRDPALARTVRATGPLRELLIQLLDDGWTSGDERSAILFLRGL
jgi:hypothetical protein